MRQRMREIIVQGKRAANAGYAARRTRETRRAADAGDVARGGRGRLLYRGNLPLGK